MDPKEQNELIDRLNRTGKINKMEKFLAKTRVIVGQALKATGLNHIIDVDFVANEQRGSFGNFARKAESQEGFIGVNVAGKVLGTQKQRIGVQVANKVGEQKQLLGVEVANEVVDQTQGVGIQVAKTATAQEQLLGIQKVEDAGTQKQMIGGIQIGEGEQSVQEQGVGGIQIAKNITLQRQVIGGQYAEEVTRQRQNIGIELAGKVKEHQSGGPLSIKRTGISLKPKRNKEANPPVAEGTNNEGVDNG